ncbi:hypothetical protein CPB86DRAFT_761669 [Serendipita vermifera]|nr:hypothetical protein CPB86DRAFT_761669 [Serendipita vermifera]
MWRGVQLLPLLLLSEAFIVASGRVESGSPELNWNSSSSACAKNIPLADSTTSYSPISLWWKSLGSILLQHLPGDESSREPSFFNDLRIAFNIAHPTSNAPTRPGTHFYHSPLYRRDQKILKTKCRVKPLHPGEGWDGTGIPNYTPTDSNGNPLPTQTIGDGHGGGGQEVIAVRSTCNGRGTGATVNANVSTGPNGSFDWLTCGINPNSDATGWQPPFATVDQIITYPGGLRAAIEADNSPYKPCTRYVDLFETAGAEFQVPPLFIAAFALQESGCNPDVDGGGGEQGMMQISPEKCANAPNGNCKDVIYNVRTAVSFFRDVLKSVNYNAFEAVGNYNGWFRGMNYTEATTWGINGDCCRCQRNLSYLSQFFNGWILNNNNAYDLGSIHNTATC